MPVLPYRLVSRAKILVSLAEKRLYFFQGETLLGSYPVAIGKWSTPTPVGTFSVFEKIINPGGVFGSRWMGFYQEPGSKWGIHGTNNPASIGNAVSKGCIRMYNQDIERIFPLVSIGTPVIVTKGAVGGNPAVPGGGSGVPGNTPGAWPGSGSGGWSPGSGGAGPGSGSGGPGGGPESWSPGAGGTNPGSGSGSWGPGSGSPGGRVHVVKKGETLWLIAQRYGVPLNTLIQLNQLANPHLLQPGQVIRLP